MIHFEQPKNQSSILKVIGVGGGGGNAVNYMYNLGLDGVDFLVCNTDQQALALSPVPNKIQLGPHLTQGLGAGANPEIGKLSGEESMEEIAKILKVNTRMAFITAGMGGGTGTGAAPVVAKICREHGILTVGIVTTPFTYEGRKRMKQAQEGIDRMREHVDTILIISNDKLRQQFGNLPFTQAFSKADNVLATAAKCITDVITTSGQVNVDFADVTTVMKNGGVAILGNAAVAGENRALVAVEEALSSPLLNDNDISGAKWILLNVTSSEGEFEHTLDELDAIQAFVQQQAGDNCDLIMGVGHDPALGDKIAVTVIATGFHHHEITDEYPVRAAKSAQPERIVVQLGDVAGSDGGSEGFSSSAFSNRPFTVQPEASNAFQPESSSQDLMPRLVEEPQQGSYASIRPLPIGSVPEPEQPVSNLKPLPLNIPEEKPAERYSMEVVEKGTESRGAATMLGFDEMDEGEEEAPVQMSFREETSMPRQDTIGDRRMSAEELEEKRRFEEQKRQLEERAERLRRLSFNIKNDGVDDMENVPAYMRQNKNLDSGLRSTDTFYSGYSVGINDNAQTGSLQSINTFLEGKKPD